MSPYLKKPSTYTVSLIVLLHPLMPHIPPSAVRLPQQPADRGRGCQGLRRWHRRRRRRPCRASGGGRRRCWQPAPPGAERPGRRAHDAREALPSPPHPHGVRAAADGRAPRRGARRRPVRALRAPDAARAPRVRGARGPRLRRRAGPRLRRERGAGEDDTYFASLPAMLGSGSGGGGRPYDYVMKVDDDTFLRLDALVETLRAVPREDMYCGAGLPFHDRQFPPFMLGMGYLLSWDLVEWIASSDMVRKEAMGVEDLTTGKWLNMGNKAKNRVNLFPRMYDYKSAKAEDFLENTIGVHQLKPDLRWAHTLEHFNLTRVGPSSNLHSF